MSMAHQRKYGASLGFTDHDRAHCCAGIFPVCNKKPAEEQHTLG